MSLYVAQPIRMMGHWQCPCLASRRWEGCVRIHIGNGCQNPQHLQSVSRPCDFLHQFQVWQACGVVLRLGRQGVLPRGGQWLTWHGPILRVDAVCAVGSSRRLCSARALWDGRRWYSEGLAEEAGRIHDHDIENQPPIANRLVLQQQPLPLLGLQQAPEAVVSVAVWVTRGVGHQLRAGAQRSVKSWHRQLGQRVKSIRQRHFLRPMLAA
mmetsp:Transcript_41205/g.73901  ORF Transcript_41205/g.73901 Transcript_41205/m.73901 type:complete len:210 (-) Transcript_41205:1508-2137(-)